MAGLAVAALHSPDLVLPANRARYLTSESSPLYPILPPDSGDEEKGLDSSAFSDPPDSALPYPLYPIDPLNPRPLSPFDIEPAGGNEQAVFNPETGEYELQKTIGAGFYGDPRYMSFEEYQQYELERQQKDYFKARSDANQSLEREGIIPKIYVGPKIFDRIFGGSFVDIRPQGNAELRFGYIHNKTENPNIAVQQRSIGNFDFNMNIQMNVVGKIGEKLKFTASQNTQPQFEFDNRMKLEYTGFDDDIIKKLEAGNVTLPLRGTLIQGSQNLFGIKTELQFGRLTVTQVLSQQRGQSQSVDVRGGQQLRTFDIPADQYDQNRHFFLGQYFRERYNDAVSQLPLIKSAVNITRVEVWVTKGPTISAETRDIAGFQDLGENSRTLDPELNETTNHPRSGANLDVPANEANQLYSELVVNAGLRESNTFQQTIQGAYPSYVGNLNFEKLFARKLSPSEFTFNPRLGFVSLNNALNNNEVLCVAYEYTLNGQKYQVGEFAQQDTASVSLNSQVLYLKMLKSSILRVDVPVWDLMMKNVYSLNAYQLSQTDFRLNLVYQDVRTGPKAFLPACTPELPLLQVLGFDRLDPQQNLRPDGLYDWIEGVTVLGTNGRIIFPLLEPFGSDLRAKMVNCTEEEKSRYVFQELYDSIPFSARQYPERNRFRIQGSYQGSASGNIIQLNAVNIPEGSVRVTADGRLLQEGSDYQVDYTQGTVKILNLALVSSGANIQATFENNPGFQLVPRNMIGTRLDYKLNRDVTVGGTYLRLGERPLTQKVNIGEEPIANTMLGFDGTYRTESRYLTRLVDRLPLIQTKEISTISASGEFAQLIPGNARAITKNGISYIDDFEGAETSLDIRLANAWTMASTPLEFPESRDTRGLSSGYNRALLSWHTIDPIFFRTEAPENVRTNDDILSNHYQRQVLEQEVFPNRQLPNTQPPLLGTLDLAYYPTERGQYNFIVNDTVGAAGIEANGRLKDPRSRWGGIMRKIETTNFEENNIDYIEFWMMDPFAYNPTSSGGEFYINLGNVSEDALKDNRISFEHGLPNSATRENVDRTQWGYVPAVQPIVNAFDNNPEARPFQDIGYDGADDTAETRIFTNFISAINNAFPGTGAAAIASLDPSNDNYEYFLGGDADAADLDILQRYKRFNMPQGNSPAQESNTNPELQTTATNLPNNEDINLDFTLPLSEQYWYYKVNLRPQDMQLGKNFIYDVYTSSPELKNGQSGTIKWYQFRIPVRKPDGKRGDIQDWKAIQNIRMYMTGWEDSAVLRFASLQLVRADWRRYLFSLQTPGEYIPVDNSDQTEFFVSTVNIEENGNRSPVPYRLPPGIQRVTNQFTTNYQQLNEQSLQFRFCNLKDGDGRAAFKNTVYDLRAYKRLRMFMHAEGPELRNNELNAFVRVGADLTANYYEYELPLAVTAPGTNTDEGVWPAVNEMDIVLEELVNAKNKRNNLGYPFDQEYVTTDSRGRVIRVIGNPVLNNVQSIMLGIRNPKATQGGADDGSPLCGEVWFNELRLTDFDNSGGWAAVSNVQAKLADLAVLNLSGSRTTIGFGSIDKRPLERNREDATAYDVASTIELGKFFKQDMGIRIPMYVGFGETFILPQFNPYSPDILLAKQLSDPETRPEQKDSVRQLAETYLMRKSLNFTNVQKQRTNTKRKPKLYDVENLTLNYAYTEQFQRNPFTVENRSQTWQGGIGYTFATTPKNIRPFDKLIKNKWLGLIKDINFNYSPSTLSFRADVNRLYQKLELRNTTDPSFPLPPNYNKNFTLNRFYGIRWDLTKSLRLEFDATNYTRIDEPIGALDTREKRDTVRQNLAKLGTNTRYTQTYGINYTLPFNKFPLTDFITATVRYGGSYDWTTAPPAIAFLGNTIQNSQQQQANGQVNLVQLYNKSKYLRDINNNVPPKPKPLDPEKEAAKEEQIQEIPKKLTAAQRRRARKKAARKRKKERKLEAKRKKAAKKNKGEANLGDENQEEITDEEVPKAPIGAVIARGLIRAAMGVRNLSGTYTYNRGTLLPGFQPVPNLLGNTPGFNAPGLGFVFGDQTDIRPAAVQNRWLSSDTLQNNLFAQTSQRNYSLRATVEPLRDFRLELTATKNQSLSSQSIFRADENGSFRDYNPYQTGDYSISTVSFNTAFEAIPAETTGEIFRDFERKRIELARQFSQNNPNSVDTLDRDGFPSGYGRTSQDVLIPSFFNAYTGNDRASNPFPSVPLPNWRLSYNGLSRLKFVKKFMQSLTLNHAYRSVYTVSNYISSLDYNERNGAAFNRDTLSGNFFPEYNITQVSIAEGLTPFLGIDATLKNSLTFRAEYATSRTVTLSIVNRRVNETLSRDFTVGMGYRLKASSLPFQIGSGRKKQDNDINIRADVSFRNNRTIAMDLDNERLQNLGGNRVLTIRPSIDYVLNERINLRLFFDRVVTDPYVNNSFRTAQTSGGVVVRFTLSQ